MNSIFREGLRITSIKIPMERDLRIWLASRKSTTIWLKKELTENRFLSDWGWSHRWFSGNSCGYLYARNFFSPYPHHFAGSSGRIHWWQDRFRFAASQKFNGLLLSVTIGDNWPPGFEHIDEKDFLNGLVEIIKIGLVSNPKILNFIQQHYEEILKKTFFICKNLFLWPLWKKWGLLI